MQQLCEEWFTLSTIIPNRAALSVSVQYHFMFEEPASDVRYAMTSKVESVLGITDMHTEECRRHNGDSVADEQPLHQRSSNICGPIH